MTLLLRLIPYLLPLLAGLGLGGWLTHEADSVPYNRLQSRYSALQTKTANDRAQAEKTAREALQAQAAQRDVIERNNEHVMQDLQGQLAATTADRDFATRLLRAAQARTSSRSDAVQKTPGGPRFDDASGASGDRQASELAGLTSDSATECRIAIQRLSALQAELAPQL